MPDTDSPFSNQSEAEGLNQTALENMMTSLPTKERLRNIPLFMRQKDLAHVLFMAEVYRQILDVPGYVAEFGVMWGRNLNLLHCLRECYEPYNHTRQLLGFDTFSGFLGSDEKDAGSAPEALRQKGSYGVPEDHRETLTNILGAQEAISHLSHLRRFELIAGDVTETVPAYLDANPHAVLALCYFDLDLHRPSAAVLKAVLPRMTRGSIVVFDELISPAYPGETIAAQEIMGLANVRLRRGPLSGWKTYFVVE